MSAQVSISCAVDTDFYFVTAASELMIPPGAQSQVLDGDDEGGSKRRKSAEAAVDTHYIIRKLDEFLSEKLHPSSSEEDAGSDSVDAAAEAQRKRERNTRSIESLRKTYNKEFLSTSAKGACPHCGSVTKTIVFFK